MQDALVTTMAVTLVAGVGCQALARRLRVPAIVPLLFAGFLLGPNILGVVTPGALDIGLNVLVGFAVAIILFEGGLSLKTESFRLAGRMIRNLVFFGALLTWGLSAVFAWWLFPDLGPALCLLFGALVIVTGPTVIAPLLKALHPRQKVADILRGESILIDPVGALCAVLVLEFIIGMQAAGGGWSALGGFGVRVALGTGLGAVGAWGLDRILRHQEIVAPDLKNLTVLAGAIGLYTASELILGESGVLTATLCGFLLGWMHPPGLDEVEEFKGHITVLMVSMVFILLAADIDASAITGLGMAGVVLVLLIIFVVRPATIFACAIGCGLSLREKLFLSWIAPRGIVAAAVSSLFALHLSHLPDPILGGETVRTLTFAVIVGTVVVQGPTARYVGRMLGMLEDRPNGFLIVGANLAARSVGRALKRAGFRVLLVDTNPWTVKLARDAGLSVRKGNALDEIRMEELDTDGVGHVLAMTPNDGVNRLAVRIYGQEYGAENVRAIRMAESPDRAKVPSLPAYLFGRRLDWEELERRLVAGATIEEAAIDEDVSTKDVGEVVEGAIPLFALDAQRQPRFLDDDAPLQVGDTLFYLVSNQPGRGG